MGCRPIRTWDEEAPAAGRLGHSAHLMAEAVLLPCRRPLAHDGRGDGSYDWGTAHYVRSHPVGGLPLPTKPDQLPAPPNPCHRGYGVEVRKPDGSWTVLYASQPLVNLDSCIWHEAVGFRQDGGCPDGLLPDGAYGERVEHWQPYPVEALYMAELLTCGGINI